MWVEKRTTTHLTLTLTRYLLSIGLSNLILPTIQEVLMLRTSLSVCEISLIWLRLYTSSWPNSTRGMYSLSLNIRLDKFPELRPASCASLFSINVARVSSDEPR